MTNKTYDLKPGYYWKVSPNSYPSSSATLCLMQVTTTWTTDTVVSSISLERNPEDYETELKIGMARIKTYYPSKFADYSEDVINYSKALRNVTSSVIN